MDTKYDYYEFYTTLSNWFSRHPRLIGALRIFNQLAVVIMYLAYLGALLVAVGQAWPSPVALFQTVGPLVIIPGLGFGILTLARRYLNAPRPYDEWMIDPLIPREKHGDSLPSRHVFSATVISLVAWRVAWLAGVVLLVLTVLLALARVLGGVHYPRDVVAGMLCGIICGALLWLF